MSNIQPLYKLSTDYNDLKSIVSDDELTVEAIENTLTGVKDQFEKKAEAVLIIANGFDHNVSALDTEINRLKSLKDGYVNKQKSLKEYLRVNMERAGIKKIQCDLFTITLRKAVEVVIITEESHLPDEYVNVKTVITPDKRAISSALKSGKTVEGAEMVTGKTSILIK
jgi:hypothetical protein